MRRPSNFILHQVIPKIKNFMRNEEIKNSFGLSSSQVKYYSNSNKTILHGGQRLFKLNPEQENQLKNLICSLEYVVGLSTLQQLVLEHLGFNLNINYIWKFLKKNNFTRKKANIVQSSKFTIENLNRYTEHLNFVASLRFWNNLYFLDEVFKFNFLIILKK